MIQIRDLEQHFDYGAQHVARSGVIQYAMSFLGLLHDELIYFSE